MKFERASGIILHPTSFTGSYGIGDIGPEAYRWVDFLKQAGCSLWQILPLGPTGYGDSPYQCFSAFAGNPYLISPTVLLDEDLLHKRFGEPAQRIREAENNTTHWLYPERGLDIALNDEGQAVMQYVSPKAFSKLMAPLLERESQP